MKRLFYALFMLIFAFPVMAQVRSGDFSMSGTASQVMTSAGLVGAHPSFPLNSIVKVTNPRNGREIEVTITGRIELSQNRIIDLSFAAVQALEMRAGETVIITVSAPPRPSNLQQGDRIVELFNPVILPRDRQIAQEQPVITEIPLNNQTTREPDIGNISRQTDNIELQQTVTIWSADAQAPDPVRIVQEARSVNISQSEIILIPGLPDRNSGNIYRLQVGAFSLPESASRTALLLRNAGFAVEQEYTGSVYRVLVTGIVSGDIYNASIRLGSMGFSQIWVRE